MTRLFRALLLALAVGFGLVAGRAAAADKVPVTISVRASLQGDSLRIRGTATVPDGAWIIYAAYRPDAPRTRATGYARVAHRRWAADVDVAGWPPGRIAVDAHFQILLPRRKQPAAVIARYGPRGARMTGPDVVAGGAGFRAAVASTAVTKPR